MDDILTWLCMVPRAASDDLTRVLGVSRATINRRLGHLHDEALAVSRMVGRRRPATRRWIPTVAGLAQVYEVGHGRNDHGPYDHVHEALFPENEDHQHVPWWLGRGGVGELYQKLEPLEAFYELAPCLFDGKGHDWLAGGLETALTGVRFLRRGQLVEMCASYNGGIEIAFCWVGRQLKPLRMTEKWENRFSHPFLDYRSEAKEERGFGDIPIPGSPDYDPDYDPTPQPSGYVMIGPDNWSVRRSMDLTPRQGYLRENAFSWWVAGNELRLLGQHGLVYPVRDRVVDRFEDVRVGSPETVAPPSGAGLRDDPPAPAVLSNVVAHRILALCEEWPALQEHDFLTLLREFRRPSASKVGCLGPRGAPRPSRGVLLPG